MSENVVVTKRLQGLGGWLVLFQIYIIMAVSAPFQRYLLALAFQDMTGTILEPYYIVLSVATFIIALVCMICFYRKQIAFRLLFVIYAAISIAFSIYYNFSEEAIQIINENSTTTGFFQGYSVVVLIISNGLLVALIIALFKSQRVKNTFN